MTTETRRRKFREITLSGTSWNDFGGGVTNGWTNHGPYTIAEHQLTTSEGHAWPKGRGVRDVGGNFDTLRTRYRANYDVAQRYSFGSSVGISRRYTGNILADTSIHAALRADATADTLRSFVPSLGDSALGAMGASAISAVAPTNPVVDGSVAMAELVREGIPSMIGAQLFKSRARSAKAAGSEYLNVQFGWLPLISDLQATAKAVIQAETIVKQLLRDSGKNVRRRYDFPQEITVNQASLGSASFPWPHLTLYHWTNGSEPPQFYTKTDRSVWFEGCFTYYLPPEALEGISGAATKARLLYGVKLTPDVLWNLAPWSWLVDWVFNVGPVMNNLGLFSNDGLTLRYGYTMEHTMVERAVRYPGLKSIGTGNLPATPKFSLQGERKIRRKQSPFVLGLTGSEFTLRRASILAALGLTKM